MAPVLGEGIFADAMSEQVGHSLFPHQPKLSRRSHAAGGMSVARLRGSMRGDQRSAGLLSPPAGTSAISVAITPAATIR